MELVYQNKMVFLLCVSVQSITLVQLVQTQSTLVPLTHFATKENAIQMAQISTVLVHQEWSGLLVPP